MVDRKGRALVIRVLAAPSVTDRGVVTAVTKASVTISTSAGNRTFALDRSTRFRVNGGTARRGAVRPGASVTVTHAIDGPAKVVNVLKRRRERRSGARRHDPAGRGRGGHRALVRTYLENDGFRVIWAARGATGLWRWSSTTFGSRSSTSSSPTPTASTSAGRSASSSRLPIVIVTARDEEVDRITGLELGADDYVTKPFSPRELVARVRAVLRRADRTPTRRARRSATSCSTRRPDRLGRREPVELTGMEFDLLAFLLAHPGIVMSRERLLERVWGLSFPGGTRTVDVHVAQLRKKLDRPDLIRTVRGSGYKAVA